MNNNKVNNDKVNMRCEPANCYLWQSIEIVFKFLSLKFPSFFSSLAWVYTASTRFCTTRDCRWLDLALITTWGEHGQASIKYIFKWGQADRQSSWIDGHFSVCVTRRRWLGIWGRRGCAEWHRTILWSVTGCMHWCLGRLFRNFWQLWGWSTENNNKYIV